MESDTQAPNENNVNEDNASSSDINASGNNIDNNIADANTQNTNATNTEITEANATDTCVTGTNAEDVNNTNSTENQKDGSLNCADAYKNLMHFADIKVDIQAVLGTINMSIEQFLKLSKGAIVTLDQHKDDNVQIRINNHSVGQGQILAIENHLNVTVLSMGKKNDNITEGDLDMSAAMEEMDMAGAMEDDMSAAMEDMDMAGAMEDDMSAAMEEMDMEAAMKEME